MYRNVKCLLITLCACALLLVIVSRLQGRDVDRPADVLQPNYKRENAHRNIYGAIQKSQPNHIEDDTGQNAHEAHRKSQLDFRIDSASQDVRQVIQALPSALPIQTTPKQAQQTALPVKNPVPSDDVLKSMSHKDLFTFYHSYVNSPQVPCSRVERMGKLADGGWELCDDPLYRPLKGDCLVYSYGINNDFSYDDDMASYGCEVHAFDPSMNTGPQLRGERVFFHPSGVGAKNETILSEKMDLWQMYSIGDHRRLLQHTPDQRRLDIVKMDVEGHELFALTSALDDGSLDDVRQLAFETHAGWTKNDPTREEYIKFLTLFRKVYEKGFRIYVTHRNVVWSAFESLLFLGKSRAHCHEIHTININIRNTVNGDGTVVGDGAVSDSIRQARHNKQIQLLQKETFWYQHFRGPVQRQAVKGMGKGPRRR